MRVALWESINLLAIAVITATSTAARARHLRETLFIPKPSGHKQPLVEIQQSKIPDAGIGLHALSRIKRGEIILVEFSMASCETLARSSNDVHYKFVDVQFSTTPARVNDHVQHQPSNKSKHRILPLHIQVPLSPASGQIVAAGSEHAAAESGQDASQSWMVLPESKGSDGNMQISARYRRPFELQLDQARESINEISSPVFQKLLAGPLSPWGHWTLLDLLRKCAWAFPDKRLRWVVIFQVAGLLNNGGRRGSNALCEHRYLQDFGNLMIIRAIRDIAVGEEVLVDYPTVVSDPSSQELPLSWFATESHESLQCSPAQHKAAGL